jgi:hypothetical protein
MSTLPAAYRAIQGDGNIILEPLGATLAKDWRKFCDVRDRLAATWPRLCTECGAEFRPSGKGPGRTLKRCAACRGL